MQLISKSNKGFRFLLCVIDIFRKYAWVVPLKDKKGVSIFNAFQIVLKQFNRKPNKIWIDKGSEFYNNSFNGYKAMMFLGIQHINKGKSVAAERFIRTLKKKLYKYLTPISKNVYVDKLDDIVNECNNTYHNNTIKMKPVDAKDNTYINIGKNVNDKDPKFKVVDHVRISNTKFFLLKAILQICLKKFL